MEAGFQVHESLRILDKEQNWLQKPFEEELLDSTNMCVVDEDHVRHACLKIIHSMTNLSPIFFFKRVQMLLFFFFFEKSNS